MPQKSRVGKWNEPVSGFENNIKPQNPTRIEVASNNESHSFIRTREAKKMLVPLAEVSDSDIFLDISENATEHIKNSAAISYEKFIDDIGLSISASKISKMLGDAGISEKDAVVIYGECLPCGGGPSPATYVYWVMKSLGHDKVRVLDGTLKDWKAAGKPISTEVIIRPKMNYTPQFDPEILATYAYVKSGKPQIVDARAPLAYATSSIIGAFNIPYDGLVQDGRLKDEKDLEDIFTGLSKDRPVVVYTDTGIKGSLAWFVLELLGYNAKLYSFKDWLANQMPPGNATQELDLTS
jgi:thiosulfate/3-mercaptopyruvate sulfurtransferase